MSEDKVLHLPCDVQAVSDGYHTFQELYEHRHMLFLTLMHAHPMFAWKSRLHHDGTAYPGWWIGGMELPTGSITYHLPDRLWDMAHVTEHERGLPFDGHTPMIVLERLRQLTEHEYQRT